MLDLSGLVLFVAEILMYVVPGFVIARLAGLSAWSAVAYSTAAAFGVTTLAGPASAALGLRWNVLVFLLTCGVTRSTAGGAMRLLAGPVRVGFAPR